VLGALAAVGLLALLLLRPEAAQPPRPQPASPPSTPRPAERASGPRPVPGDPRSQYTHDLGPPMPTEPDGPCGNRCACASTSDPCQSNRTCTPGTCTDPMEKKAWRMRLGALKLAKEPPGGLADDAAVCVKPAGSREQTCTTFKQVKAKGCAAGTGLRVTTDQLTGAGVDIEVRDAERNVIAQAEQASYKFLTDRELCLGVRFGGSKFTGKQPVEMITFYLDEP
jgi:hypothetical protein